VVKLRWSKIADSKIGGLAMLKIIIPGAGYEESFLKQPKMYKRAKYTQNI